MENIFFYTVLTTYHSPHNRNQGLITSPFVSRVSNGKYVFLYSTHQEISGPRQHDVLDIKSITKYTLATSMRAKNEEQ